MPAVMAGLTAQLPHDAVQLMWKRMGQHGQSSWHTHALPLGVTGSVLCADMAADAEANLRGIAVTDDDQKAVHIMCISGDPTLGELLYLLFMRLLCITWYTASLPPQKPMRQHSMRPVYHRIHLRPHSHSF